MSYEREGITPRIERIGLDGMYAQEGFRAHGRVFRTQVILLAAGPLGITQAFIGDGAGEVACWLELTTGPTPGEVASRLALLSRRQFDAACRARPVDPEPLEVTFFALGAERSEDPAVARSVSPLVVPAGLVRYVLDAAGQMQPDRVCGKCSPSDLRRGMLRAREAFPMVPAWVADAQGWDRGNINETIEDLEALAAASQAVGIEKIGWG